MKKRWKLLVILLPILFAGWLTWFLAQRGHVGPPTISKETTFVEGPVNPEGYIDYFAAYNELYSQGISPEENGAVQLVAALGPQGSIDFETYWKRVTDHQGGWPVPEGPFVSELDEHVSEEESTSDEFFEMWDEVLSKPWSAKENPAAKKWIDANENGIRLAMLATTKKYFYLPLVPLDAEDLSIANGQYDYQAGLRMVARVLVAKALWLLAENRIEECQDHLIAARRLALQLQQNSGLFFDFLICSAISDMAREAEGSLLAFGNLTAKQIARYQKYLDELQPPQPMIQFLDVGERLHALSIIQCLHQDGTDYLELDWGPRVRSHSFDIDLVMKECNRRIDEIVAVLEIADETERWARSDALAVAHEKEANAIEAGHRPWVNFCRSWLGRRARSAIVVEWMFRLADFRLEPYESVWRSQMLAARIVRVALEIELHAIEKGDYPDSLQALSQTEFAKTNADWDIDPHSGKTFVYKKGAAGFLLYSIGPDGVDDGGASYEDSEANGMAGYDDVIRKNYQPVENED